MDLIGSECVDGMREVEYKWADIDGDNEMDCDPTHHDSIITDLPAKRKEPCKHCSQGMSKDAHGNCTDCPIGTFQPKQLDDTPGVVECQKCEGGHYAMTVYDMQEFEQLSAWLNRQKCNPITLNTSNSSCLFH